MEKVKELEYENEKLKKVITDKEKKEKERGIALFYSFRLIDIIIRAKNISDLIG